MTPGDREALYALQRRLDFAAQICGNVLRGHDDEPVAAMRIARQMIYDSRIGIDRIIASQGMTE